MYRALRKAGVKAVLHIYDGQAHGDYMQNLLRPVPECEDAQRELLNFFDKHLKQDRCSAIRCQVTRQSLKCLLIE